MVLPTKSFLTSSSTQPSNMALGFTPISALPSPTVNPFRASPDPTPLLNSSFPTRDSLLACVDCKSDTVSLSSFYASGRVSPSTGVNASGKTTFLMSVPKTNAAAAGVWELLPAPVPAFAKMHFQVATALPVEGKKDEKGETGKTDKPKTPAEINFFSSLSVTSQIAIDEIVFDTPDCSIRQRLYYDFQSKQVKLANPLLGEKRIINPKEIALTPEFQRTLFAGWLAEQNRIKTQTGMIKGALSLDYLQKMKIGNLQDLIDFVCFSSMTSCRCFNKNLSEIEKNPNVKKYITFTDSERLTSVSNFKNEEIPSHETILYQEVTVPIPVKEGQALLLPCVALNPGDICTIITWNSSGTVLGAITTDQIENNEYFPAYFYNTITNPERVPGYWSTSILEPIYVYIHKHVKLTAVDGSFSDSQKASPQQMALIDGTQILLKYTIIPVTF